MNIKNQIKADKELIKRRGGPTKVCELLGYDKARGGVQRVQNWTRRGIPPRVKLDRPDIFIPPAIAGPPRKPPKVPP